jgi:hypothetical protein
MVPNAVRVLGLFRRLDFTRQFQFHVNNAFHSQHEIAGVFNAPRYVGHFESGGSLPVIADELGMHRRHQIMVGAMNGKYAVQLGVRWAGGRYVTVDLRRPEHQIRVFGSLQDLFVHARIAGAIAAFPAGRRDDDLATGAPGFGIEMEVPAPNSEGAVYQMQGAFDAPVHGGLSGIDGQKNVRAGNFTRLKRSRSYRRG